MSSTGAISGAIASHIIFSDDVDTVIASNQTILPWYITVLALLICIGIMIFVMSRFK
jgi:hypothetical protein